MSGKPFSAKTNWSIAHGTEIEHSVSVECIRDVSLAKSLNIDDITGAQRAILLSKETTKKNEEQSVCHLKLNTNLQYGTPLITLICDCSKIELFTGSYEEYIKICYGELLDEFEGTKSFIFELNFTKNVSDILLKFITTEEQIWIYGIHMYLIEIPLNIFRPTIDIDNVQSMLTNHQISPNAEKCKEFIKMHMNTNRSNGGGPPTMAALMSFINSKIDNAQKSVIDNNSSSSSVNGESNGNEENRKSVQMNVTNQLNSFAAQKSYIDNRIKELENSIVMKIDQRFNEMEMRQNEKLNKIILLLENLKN